LNHHVSIIEFAFFKLQILETMRQEMKNDIELACQNNSHTTGKQQSLQKMCTEWEAITMCIELLQYTMLMKNLKN
jgi:hypothetical protein